MFRSLIYLCSILLCANGLIRNYYFINEPQQNADEEWSSKEELSDYPKEESNENDDFKFDDQSSFKVSSLFGISRNLAKPSKLLNRFVLPNLLNLSQDSEEEEKDAANELYQFWNNLDMCNDVSCRNDQVCRLNKQNVAVCVDRPANGGRSGRKNFTTSTYQSKTRNGQRKCDDCPQLDMNDRYCASNNRSYPSLCELIKFNCEQGTDFYPLCQDKCPCSKKINLNKKLKLDYLWKYVNNVRQSKRLNRQSAVQKSARNEPKQPSKVGRSRGRASAVQARICSAKELNEMGQRLFQWFQVILKNQLENENLRSTKILNKIRASLVKNCDEEVNFMFLSLDTNKDLRLSMDELYHLEHDQQREKCLQVYMDSCDSNNDQMLNNNEFCNCFNQYRPCYKERNSLLLSGKKTNNKRSISYLPNCDKNGYFEPLQCDKFTKFCWCTDKNGNELANTKKLGKVVCGKCAQW